MSNRPNEFSKILIGIDDHEQARDALSLGAALANTFGSEVLVAAALEYDPLPIDTQGYDEARAKHFHRIFEGVEELLEGIPHRRFELDREAVSSLEEFAQRESADLIVIGSTHRGALSRAVSGTVADHLVEAAPCPLLIAPHGYAGRVHAGMGTIGVGFDGSDGAITALSVAERLAASLDCELRVVGAVPAYEGVPDPLRPTREGVYRERVAVGRRKISAVPAKGVVEFGDAAQVLAAQGLDLDLIVVGSRGHGRLLRTVMGSVASDLVRIAPCPVLVVPHAEGDDPSPRPAAGRGVIV